MGRGDRNIREEDCCGEVVGKPNWRWSGVEKRGVESSWAYAAIRVFLKSDSKDRLAACLEVSLLS